MNPSATSKIAWVPRNPFILTAPLLSGCVVSWLNPTTLPTKTTEASQAAWQGGPLETQEHANAIVGRATPTKTRTIGASYRIGVAKGTYGNSALAQISSKPSRETVSDMGR
jgi:hypothetical protein